MFLSLCLMRHFEPNVFRELHAGVMFQSCGSLVCWICLGTDQSTEPKNGGTQEAELFNALYIILYYIAIKKRSCCENRLNKAMTYCWSVCLGFFVCLFCICLLPALHWLMSIHDQSTCTCIGQDSSCAWRASSLKEELKNTTKWCSTKYFWYFLQQL